MTSPIPPVTRMSLQSTSVDEVRAFGGRHFYPRKFLHPLHRSGHLAARFDLLRLGPLTIGDVRYGADVTLGYEQPAAYQIGVPLAGRLEAHQGGRALVSEGRQGALFRIGEDVVLDRWGADCRQLGVKIDRDVLERQLQTLLDAPVETSIRLPAHFDLGDGMGLSWARMARLVAAEFANDTGLLNNPLIATHLCESLITGILLATDHPHRDLLTRHTQAYRPEPVRRAIDAMRAQPEHPFTLASLAHAAGVSPRTLQAGFKRYAGSTPMEYLRHVRLGRAHDELRVADPQRTTVAEVAHRWGFTHLGRFASAYRARYGTKPSRTLHAS